MWNEIYYNQSKTSLVCMPCDRDAIVIFNIFSSRHCGRVLCKRCSVIELPIMKFNLQKPVRVCQLCNDVLTHGTAAAR